MAGFGITNNLSIIPASNVVVNYTLLGKKKSPLSKMQDSELPKFEGKGKVTSSMNEV